MRLPILFIVRHCKTAWNAEGRLQGKADIPLSEEGRAEANKNVRLLQPLGITRIWTSTMLRAVQTAHIYAEGLNVPYQSCPQFDELDHGDWEGRYFNDLYSEPSSGFLRWMQDPENSPIPRSLEAATLAQRRIVAGIRHIACAHEEKAVLVVSHKHLIALLMCALEGRPLSSFQCLVDESVEPRKIPEEILVSLLEASDVGPNQSASGKPG